MSRNKKTRDEILKIHRGMLEEYRKVCRSELFDEMCNDGVLNLSVLSPHKEEILRMIYKETKTLNEVGEHFSITRERVRQLRDAAAEDLLKTIKKEQKD